MFLFPIMCVQCLVIKIQYPYVIVYHISLYQWNETFAYLLFDNYLYILYSIKGKLWKIRNQKIILIISISINNINQYVVDGSSLKLNHKFPFQMSFTQPFDNSTKEKLLKYFQSIQSNKGGFKESNRLEAKGIFKTYFC